VLLGVKASGVGHWAGQQGARGIATAGPGHATRVRALRAVRDGGRLATITGDPPAPATQDDPGDGGPR
jgi:hypothetical protein